MAERYGWWRAATTAASGSASADPPAVSGARPGATSAADDQPHGARSGPPPHDAARYRVEDHDLLHLTESPVDATIGSLVDRFVTCDTAGRAARTARLGQHDLHDLIAFARRSSAVALRLGDPSIAERGARALAMVDAERVDRRDLLWAGRLVAYVLGRDGKAGPGVLRRASALASGETAALLTGLAQDDGADLDACGYRVAETAEGLGFIVDGGEDYSPDHDLVAVSLAVVAALDDDPWHLSSPEVGQPIAPVWFQRRSGDDVGAALERVTGCVTVDGQLRGDDPVTTMRQHLLVLVVETDTASAADVLASAVGAADPSWFVGASAVHDRLCAVAVSRSVVKGGIAVETAESIQRFASVFERALAAGHRSAGPPRQSPTRTTPAS